MLGPQPSSRVAPSIWKLEVDTPQVKSRRSAAIGGYASACGSAAEELTASSPGSMNDPCCLPVDKLDPNHNALLRQINRLRCNTGKLSGPKLNSGRRCQLTRQKPDGATFLTGKRVGGNTATKVLGARRLRADHLLIDARQ